MNKKKVTLRMEVEMRSRNAVRSEFYTCECEVPDTRNSVEDFRPFILEKTVQTPFGVTQTRTHITVKSYDPATETIEMFHSLPQSKADEFTFHLLYDYGWKQED